jgi:hypothetical protein
MTYTKTLKFSSILLFFCLFFSANAITAQTMIILDHDNDGIVDTMDDDDDNDGILDEIERQAPNPDMDNDGIPNIWDLDSDNDGISDAIEAGFADINGDGIVDGFVDKNRDGVHDLLRTDFFIADTDLDNLPNWIDTDSNNDGLVDAVAMGGLDENGDGRLDGFRDSDGDGFHDKVDGDVGNILYPGDSSLTSSSKSAFIPNLEEFKNYRTLQRLARTCSDVDMDGLCDEYDGDVGNTLRLGYDFLVEEL